jgi:hypothetical protein
MFPNRLAGKLACVRTATNLRGRSFQTACGGDVSGGGRDEHAFQTVHKAFPDPDTEGHLEEKSSHQGGTRQKNSPIRRPGHDACVSLSRMQMATSRRRRGPAITCAQLTLGLACACSMPPPQSACADGDCPKADEISTIRNSTAHVADSRAVRPCDGDTCPDGCCSEGACLRSSAIACGLNGVACEACAVTADTCVDGQCRCGAGSPCSSGQSCSGGVCTCGPDTCSGCCCGNSCVRGDSDGNCGSNGTECSDCRSHPTTNACCRNDGVFSCGLPGCG